MKGHVLVNFPLFYGISFVNPTIYFFCSPFQCVGAVVLSIGSWMLAKSNEFLDLFSEDTLVVVAGMMVGVGCFAFLVGFCGCCGALKESKCLLYTVS